MKKDNQKFIEKQNLLRTHANDQNIAITREYMYRIDPNTITDAIETLKTMKDTEDHIKILIYNWASIGFNLTCQSVLEKVIEESKDNKG